MPAFLTPVHESNDCHLPAGSPEGGQFGAKGECFANVNRLNVAQGQEGDVVVHGRVTNVEGKTFPHAWIERGDTVIDPTAGVTMPKAKYYELLSAQPEGRYTSKQAIRNQFKAGHHGPWTAEDLAPKTKKERNLARQSGVRHATYRDVSGQLDREFAAKKALLDHVDRHGSITVHVGTEGGRKVGQRKFEMLMKFVQAGVLERLPSTGVTPIVSRAPHQLKKVRGYVTEHTFRRKR